MHSTLYVVTEYVKLLVRVFYTSFYTSDWLAIRGIHHVLEMHFSYSTIINTYTQYTVLFCTSSYLNSYNEIYVAIMIIRV